MMGQKSNSLYPIVPSLSKGSSTLDPGVEEGKGFDKLSPNGFIEVIN